jgi:hypothetical protein
MGRLPNGVRIPPLLLWQLIDMSRFRGKVREYRQSQKRPPGDTEAIVRSLVERRTQQGVKAIEIGAFVSQLAANRPDVTADPS